MYETFILKDKFKFKIDFTAPLTVDWKIISPNELEPKILHFLKIKNFEQIILKKNY